MAVPALKLSVGAVTDVASVAVNKLVVLLAVAKPLGVMMVKVVPPAVSGWKAVVCVMVSPLNVSGLVTIVPTVVAELVTVTLTLKPVRMLC